MSLFEARDISVDLPREEGCVRVLSHVSFALEAGRIYDLVGPSGGGKTTLLRACALMVPLVGGDLLLDGRPSGSLSSQHWRASVCLVPQKASLVPGTVRDNLLLPWRLLLRKGSAIPHEARLRESLDSLLMEDVELDRDAARLSGGQAARVALLRAFLTEPRVVLADELDAALDDESSKAVSRLTARLADAGTAFLRIRHRASDGLAAASFELREGQVNRRG